MSAPPCPPPCTTTARHDQRPSRRNRRDEHRPARDPGLDDPLTEALVRTRRFFTRAEVSADLRTLHQVGRPAGRRLLPGPVEPRQGRALHPRRELHRLVLVEGLRQGRHHHLGDAADRLPVGRPGPPGVRAARLPPRRGVLLVHLLAHPGALPVRARRAAGDVPRGQGPHSATRSLAWADIVRRPRAVAGATSRPAARAAWSAPRWDEAIEIVAAAHVHTIKTCGPDRVAGFSPIPAMSMVSHASGARFISLIGGSMLSFYDWYADLPVASPQVFGDQTDVPESGDWWDAGYLIMWGSNVPVTRTPDAHWMAEARYRGQKVVAVSPDYADNVKFADEWLPAAARHRRRAGDGDGPRHPQGVLRRPAGRRTSPTTCKTYTDLPFLVTPRASATAATYAGQVPDRRRPRRRAGRASTPTFKTVLLDAATGEPVVPQRLARLPLRRGRASGKWNLDLGEIDPLLSAAGGDRDARSRSLLPRFDAPDGTAARAARAACRCAGSAATWSPPCST